MSLAGFRSFHTACAEDCLPSMHYESLYWRKPTLESTIPAAWIDPIIYNLTNLAHYRILASRLSQPSHMGIKTRKASMADAAQLIRVRMMAEGGFAEALFEGLDQSIEEIIEIELSEEAKDARKRKEKNRKKKVFYDLKTKKGFSRRGYGEKVENEMFHYLSPKKLFLK